MNESLIEIAFAVVFVVCLLSAFISSSNSDHEGLEEEEIGTDEQNSYWFDELHSVYVVCQASDRDAVPIPVVGFASDAIARDWIDKEKTDFKLSGGIYFNPSSQGYLNIVEVPFLAENVV